MEVNQPVAHRDAGAQRVRECQRFAGIAVYINYTRAVRYMTNQASILLVRRMRMGLLSNAPQ